jgi:hypothetical protein
MQTGGRGLKRDREELEESREEENQLQLQEPHESGEEESESGEEPETEPYDRRVRGYKIPSASLLILSIVS